MLRMYKVKREDVIITLSQPPYRVEKPEYIYWPEKKKAWLITEEGFIKTDYKKLKEEKNKKLLNTKEKICYITRLLIEHYSESNKVKEK